MEGISKKLSIRTFITLYALSYIFHSVFFVDRQKVMAAGPSNVTHLIAVIVDKNVYSTNKKDIDDYATTYVQKKEANSKAIILPINTSTIKAPDIAKILENMYFDGLKDVPSKLVGVILIGNIPLPVIQENGFMYPSIYPYVDFEEQQFVYDQNKKFFVPNNNPNGQAEIRHGMITFDTTSQYHDYFQKLKNYDANPAKFVAPKIWYDDFVGLKKYYVPENTNYYANTQIFAEDIGYHRFNNLLLNTLKGQHNDNVLAIGSGLVTDVADSDSQELKTYADMIQQQQDAASSSMDSLSSTKTPTLVLGKTIQELSKTYEGLLSTKFLTKIQSNVSSAGRRYQWDAGSGIWLNDINSHYEKIVQKDNWIVGDLASNLAPLLIGFNTAMESGLNQEIANKKYAMQYPMPIQFINTDYYLLIYEKKTIFSNFYFGTTGITITDIKDTSIYRGTYQNLSGIKNVALADPTKSVGGSYHILSQQVEANRGYNLLNTQDELTNWKNNKQYLLHKKTCDGFPGIFIPFTDICLGTQTWDDSWGDSHDFTDYKGDTVYGSTGDSAKEQPIDFAIRLRGGASPINIDTGSFQSDLYKLTFFNPKQAISPVRDIAGSQQVSASQPEANSFLGLMKYASMIKSADQAGPYLYPRAIKSAGNEHDNAINIFGIPFVAKETTGYADVDFFSTFDTQRTNTAGPIITLYHKGTTNGSGKTDSQIYQYKLINTTQQNISPTPAEINGMNVTTADRPIDSIRNVTFQGIGGDVVQLNYPNLYEVPVYMMSGDKRILKSPTQILTAITDYLTNKVVAYNDALLTQQHKEAQYYATHTDAFNFLGQANPLATPHNRTYTPLDPNFFITKLEQSLDALVTQYGNDYVYGDTIPSNKLMLIAKLLYYQNLARTERGKATTVDGDIVEAQDSFNVNQKISDTVNTYLHADNNQGQFLTPTYNDSGYEVAYINSDGFDLIQSKETPAFITNLQTIKSQKAEQVSNQMKITDDIAQSEAENEVQADCGVDPAGSALIFDIKTMKSPWLDAMKCWYKKILKEPFKINVSFKNAQGPVVAGSLKSLVSTFTGFAQEWNDYGAGQASTDEAQNQKTLATVAPGVADTVKTFDDMGEIKTSASSRFAHSAEEKTLTIDLPRALPGANHVTLSATGDACIGLQGYTKTLCKQDISFNLNGDPKTFTFLSTDVAGTMTITARFCIGSAPSAGRGYSPSDICIQKSKSVTVLPGPVARIAIKTASSPQLVMIGASVPVTVWARDAFDNQIGSVVEPYTLSVQTGTINGASKVDFSAFGEKASFIYQASSDAISQNTPITIKVTGTNQEKKPVTAEGKIIVAKGILNIYNQSQLLFSSNATQSKAFDYTLPNTPDAIVKVDANTLAQLQETSIPKISLQLVSPNGKDGNALQSVLNITSKNNLLTPGVVQNRTLELEQGNKVQRIFQEQHDFLIQDGKLDISFYPSYKAGQEELVISVPGLDPIHLFVNVLPATAQKVALTLQDSLLTFTKNLGTTNGTLKVLDYWNNLVTTPTLLKLGTIGPGLMNGVDTAVMKWTGSTIPFTLKAKQGGGGAGYLFAYISGLALTDQDPGQLNFFVQTNVLPETGLNVMYLNLFGTDWGNQRGYFSDNNKKVNALTENSDKLLTTTTQLIDPTKIKQVQVSVNPNGQIYNYTDNNQTIRLSSGHLRSEIQDMANIQLGALTQYNIVELASGSLDTWVQDRNAILYIPETPDSIISGNTIANKKLLINHEEMIDFQNGSMSDALSIQANGEEVHGMVMYDVLWAGTKVGTLALYKKVNLISDADIAVADVVKYAKTTVFLEGSTNGPQGIGIYDTTSVFSKNGYQSIEDSTDPLLGIGFTSKFKNITYFAAGQNVGQSTLPFGSAFLINFGDPLVSRVSDNINVSKTPYDSNPGENIFSNPNKTISQTIPADFNDDGMLDMLIVYTDGTIQLLKNYGGKNPYRNEGNLMLIADAIKEIHVGDVNGDHYPDIIIWTTKDKLLVYKNMQGIFDVDGTPVCLNTNIDPGRVSTTPNSLSGVNQLFFEDMDKDGNTDIITNDDLGDVKIFYGGDTSKNTHDAGSNYLSAVTGACDDQRYTRQKANYKTVKSLAMRSKSDRYITDESLVHRQHMMTPDDGVDTSATDTDEANMDTDGPAQKSGGGDYTKDDAIAMAKDVVINNNDNIVTTAKKDLAYVSNPLDRVPAYEHLAASDIYYLPISSLSGEDISVYKKYTDLNGGSLVNNDKVLITTTLLSLVNNKKITYLDQLKGPWKLLKNTDGEMTTLGVSGQVANISISQGVGPDYQIMVDNITLQAKQSIKISYIVTYQQPPLTTIQVQDEDLSDQGRPQDGYPDIAIQTADACIKSRWIARNTKNSSEQYKEYKDVLEDIDKTTADYSSGANDTQTSTITDTLDTLGSSTNSAPTQQSISSLLGLADVLENWNVKDLFSNGGMNINLNLNFIDTATAGVSKKLDEGLKGLCQGFKVNKKGCQGIPVPFNQAFLAPGLYHLFGCVPKLPNPLASVFTLINKTLGKGLPIISFPTSAVPYVAFLGVPFPGGAGGIFGGVTSQFRLYIAPTLTLGVGIAICGGPYSLSAKLPKPFRDLGGNCIVFAIPGLMTACNSDSSQNDTDTSKGGDELDDDIVKGADNGTCETPPAVSNRIVFAEDDGSVNASNLGTSSPLQIVEKPLTTLSDDLNITVGNNEPVTPLIPQGNFGGIIQMDQDPIIETTDEAANAEEGIALEPGEKINLKIVGGKTKGLIKCVVKDRVTRQLKYIVNNITKMTIQVDLPNISQIAQGFDKMEGFSDIYKKINAEDTSAGLITDLPAQSTTTATLTGTLSTFKQAFSRQQWSSISNKIGQNPFEALMMMFKDVPLINLSSKDINVKIPALTSDEVDKYYSYLKSWIAQNAQILEDWTDVINKMLALCGTTDKTEAKTTKATLEKEKIAIAGNTNLTQADKNKLNTRITSEIKDMNAIIALPQNTTRQQLGSDAKNIGINLKNTTTKITKLPYRKLLQQGLLAQQKKEGDNFSATGAARLATITTVVASLEKCSGITEGIGSFITFRENSAGLIGSVQENMKVLDQYKQFPTQLYSRIHITDRYLGEISSITSEFVGNLTYRLSTNANRFSQYVDAITLIIGAIKTWQAIINFSVDRSEKCSKCSNDNYGGFSCSLSFLCPQLPIFHIPAFKIPDIHLDLSHLELGMDIVLPKFNFVPIKVPLPTLPQLPEPPTVEVNRDVLLNLNLKIFKDMSLPTIPVIPSPPQLPELPSFIPDVNLQLPILPPAPKIPKILPEINGVLKVAKFIGQVFCIVKGGIGLVGELGVKGKIEQLTQRKWNVPVFDFFNLTTKTKEAPLEGFDYQIDAYARLKYNFEGVYSLLDTVAQSVNQVVAQTVEAPMQKGMDIVNSGINNSNMVQQLENIPDININGYLPADASGGMDYQTAYSQLRNGLLAFRQQTSDDKDMQNKINDITQTITAPGEVKPASKELSQAETQANTIVQNKQAEITQLANKVKNYDSFIKDVMKNQIQLVSKQDETTTISTPILTLNETTKSIISKQESPTKTYLKINEGLVDGYLDAVTRGSAEKLNMTPDTYNKSKTYLTQLKQKIVYAETTDTEKPLIAASCQGGNCQTSTLDENGYKQDLSSYVQGVLTSTGSGSGKTIVNVVNNEDITAQIGHNYVPGDLNNDGKKDILLRDMNTVYIKYADQENEHFSKGGGTLTQQSSKLYLYQGSLGKRRIDSTDELSKKYFTIKDITIKLRDVNQEVKNYKTEGQTFDTITLSWKNNIILGDNVDGYVIKFTHKIDHFFDKFPSFNFFTKNTSDAKYILVLPKGTESAKGFLTVDDLTKKAIKFLMTGTVIAVRYFDPNQEKVSIVINEMPRKRSYTQIATLGQAPDQLSKAQQKSFFLLAQRSPWSNQIVAGNQLLGDTEPPLATVTLHRVLMNEDVSTGNTHEGFINTYYTLNALWTDKVAVSNMKILYDGETIYQKSGFLSTGSIAIPNLFFTGTAQKEFTFTAVDPNGNVGKEVVTLTINIPQITITDVQQIDKDTTQVIAELEQDLDEGLVSFQRERNGVLTAITGSKANPLGGYFLSPGQKVVTGGIYTLGDTLGLFAPSGEAIGTIDPDNGEIIINANREKRISLQLDFLLSIPTIKVIDTKTNQSLFHISLPADALGSIQLLQGKPNYTLATLSESQFDEFQGGSCIQNASKECMLYVNAAGKIYVPGVYGSTLGGTYGFDTKTKTIVYSITDGGKSPIAKILIKTKPLISN